jgi:putative transposase
MKRFKVFPGYYLYFSTCTIVDWLPVFSKEKYFQIIINSLKYCVSHKGLYLLGYVIMPNHIHLLTANSESTSLSDIMRDFKHYTSTKIARELESDNNRLFLYVIKKAASRESKEQRYKIWNGDFHPIVIVSEAWFTQKLTYMHLNPVRKGYVINPEHWKYSSARNWILGDESIMAINYEYWG